MKQPSKCLQPLEGSGHEKGKEEGKEMIRKLESEYKTELFALEASGIEKLNCFTEGMLFLTEFR
jgi:hypothetical protein